MNGVCVRCVCVQHIFWDGSAQKSRYDAVMYGWMDIFYTSSSQNPHLMTAGASKEDCPPPKKKKKGISLCSSWPSATLVYIPVSQPEPRQLHQEKSRENRTAAKLCTALKAGWRDEQIDLFPCSHLSTLLPYFSYNMTQLATTLCLLSVFVTMRSTVAEISSLLQLTVWFPQPSDPSTDSRSKH